MFAPLSRPLRHWAGRLLLLALLAPLAMASSACNRAAKEDGSAAANTRRIISQVVLADEILWALGPQAQAQVVGISAMADDGRFSGAAGQWPASVPRVQTGSETLVSMAPDLVILASFSGVEQRALLDKAGIPLLIMDGWSGFDDYRRHIEELARAAGVPADGARLITALDQTLAALPPAPAKRPTAVSFNSGSVAGRGTTFDDVATRAGYENLAATRGLEGHGQVSLEELLTWDPDVILTSCGTSCDALGPIDPPDAVLAKTRAAESGGMLGAPSAILFSTGAGMLTLTQQLAAHRIGGGPKP